MVAAVRRVALKPIRSPGRRLGHPTPHRTVAPRARRSSRPAAPREAMTRLIRRVTPGRCERKMPLCSPQPFSCQEASSADKLAARNLSVPACPSARAHWRGCRTSASTRHTARQSARRMRPHWNAPRRSMCVRYVATRWQRTARISLFCAVSLFPPDREAWPGPCRRHTAVAATKERDFTRFGVPRAARRCLSRARSCSAHFHVRR